MNEKNWPTKQDDMRVAREIIARHGSAGQAVPLMGMEDMGDGETVQFSPSPWLAELVTNLIRIHGEEKGMGILRLVLRELGFFNKRGTERGNA